MESFGVDTLGGLTEKLKQLIDDTQNQYESLIGSTERFKQGKMKDKEYFASIGKYLIASSALNFLAVRVILELKSAFDKGSSLKSPTGGFVEPSSKESSTNFGIGGFISGGGHVGGNTSSVIHHDLAPVDNDLERSSPTNAKYITEDDKKIKNCIVCGISIPTKAKFCSKCGNSQ